MAERINDIPNDIILKLGADFESEEEYKEALEIIAFIQQDSLNI